ncbi:hypothetical protein D3C72_831200 [compost metagenome]
MPAGQGTAYGVFVGMQRLGLKCYFARLGANHPIWQRKGFEAIARPAGLRGSLHLPRRRLALQVHGQHLPSRWAGVDVHAHGQQHTAHISPIPLEHFHGHGPFAPLTTCVLEAQQAPKVIASRIESHCINMQRTADTLLRERGWRIPPARFGAKVPHAGTVFATVCGAIFVIQHDKTGTLLLCGYGAVFAGNVKFRQVLSYTHSLTTNQHMPTHALPQFRKRLRGCRLDELGLADSCRDHGSGFLITGIHGSAPPAPRQSRHAQRPVRPYGANR